MSRSQNKSALAGFSLVEVVLGIFIFSLLVTAFVGAVIYGLEAVSLMGRRARAALIAEEGIEATRNIRDSGFTNLADGTYGLVASGGRFVFFGTSDLIDVFTRQITIASVGANAKRVTAAVSWQQNAQRTGYLSLLTYFTNWQAVHGWSAPREESSLDLFGLNDGWKIVLKGNYAYVIRLNGNPTFGIIDITDLNNPALVGQLNLTGTLWGLAWAGNYVYVASNANNQELQVIDVATPNLPVLVNSYNAPGNANAQGIAVIGANLFLGRVQGNDAEFTVLDITNPLALNVRSTLNLPDSVNDIVVLGNFAYIVSPGNSRELMVVNISVISAPSLLGSVNLASNSDGLCVDGFGNTILVGRASGELASLDVTIPGTPVVLGSYDATQAIRDIAFGAGNIYAFLATDNDLADLQGIDVTNPAVISLVSSLDATAHLNGIAYEAARDRVFAVGDANNEEFIVVAPN